MPGSGVNVEHFKRKSSYSMNGSTKFLYAGRLIKVKGIMQYVEAAGILKKKYPKLVFRVLGFFDPSNPDSLSPEQIEKWHSSGIIEYAGKTNTINNYLEKVDCVVLPTQYREGVPRILIEANSMEVPVIATNSTGCRELVENGVNGLLHNMKDTKDLVQKMEQFIALNADQRIRMGQKGREKVLLRFDEKLVIDFYIDRLKREKLLEVQSNQPERIMARNSS